MKVLRAKDICLIAVIALMRMVNRLSSPLLKRLVVNSLTFTAYHLLRERRRLSEKCLDNAYGGKLKEKQKREIVKGSFHEFWQDLFWMLPSRAEREALKRIDIQGMEHLQKALKNGKGVILWESSHFGARIAAKNILNAKGFSIHQVHSREHIGKFSLGDDTIWVISHLIKPFFEWCENQFVAKIIYLPATDSLKFTRDFLNLLKQNAVLCISGDAGLAQKRISLKFLHVTRLFATGMVSLAKISGAPILPMFCVQEKNGRMRLIIESPIDVGKGVDRDSGLENSIAQYRNLLESYVREYPEMYQSWHLLEMTQQDAPDVQKTTESRSISTL